MFPPLNSTVQTAAQHTPGPWVYEETSGYVRCLDGSAVADAYESLEKPQSDINGRLIAAAPDLLAIAKRLDSAASLSTSVIEFSCAVDEFIADVRSAIAKAEGSSNA